MQEAELEALLEVARDSLRETVMPQLDDASRYDALMVANALGLGARWLALHAALEENASRRLRALYPAASPACSLAELERKIVDELRAPGFTLDGERAARIVAALLENTRGAVAIANPKALLSGEAPSGRAPAT